eukprot:scaffold26863_cov46-Phaeocystis_antarctica.AAC.2
MLPQRGRAASVFDSGNYLRWPRSHGPERMLPGGKWFSTLLSERVLVVQLPQFRQTFFLPEQRARWPNPDRKV